MMGETTVNIQLDDRIRLLSAALSATKFPQYAQARKRHYEHAHARVTTKYLVDNNFTNHPALQSLQHMLDRNTPLEALYTLVMHFQLPDLSIPQLPKWVPDGWNIQLKHFYDMSKLPEFWQKSHSVWDTALAQSSRVFHQVSFREFLRPFVGNFDETLVFMPNICYPADHEIGIRVGKQLITITPPPLAWGDSAPWPYDDDSMQTHSIRAAVTQYGRLLMHSYLRANADAVKDAAEKEIPLDDKYKADYPTWEDQFIMLFVSAAVAIYLEDYVSQVEAKSYILMEKRTRGMTILPGAISVFRRYLQEHGNKYNELAEFLSVFPAQLRVAKRIVTM